MGRVRNQCSFKACKLVYIFDTKLHSNLKYCWKSLNHDSGTLFFHWVWWQKNQAGFHLPTISSDFLLEKDKFNIQHMILISDNHLWFEVEPGSFGKAVCIQLKTLGHLKINIFLGQEIRNIFYNVSNTNENWRDICTRLETNVP